MARRLVPELLDDLPADDPRAARSRRDLTRINAAMLAPGIMARRLLAAAGDAPPRRLVELGGGDGRFLLAVARRLAPRWPGVAVLLVDRQGIVAPDTRAGFLALGWSLEPVVADVFEALEGGLPGGGPGPADAVIANLFLHHFEGEALARLLRGAAALAPLFVALEPRRSALSLAGARMVLALGANDVTRHDAVASVRAGFAGAELSALWPPDAGWALSEGAARPFSHAFTARIHRPEGGGRGLAGADRA